MNNNLPTIQELSEETALSKKENQLMFLLNQSPPQKWLKKHPLLPNHHYLPIERVEYLLSRVFTKWWVEIIDTQIIANSVVVHVRLFVKNPIDSSIDHQDGIGAAPIQTEKNAGAMDWNKAKTAGVQMAAPMAKTYAVKDAAENFGKLFGKDLSRKDQIAYDGLLKKDEPVDHLENRISLMIDNAKTVEELDNIGMDTEIPESLSDKFKTKYAELNK